MPKLKSRRARAGVRPLRYWPILLIATAAVEAVHAPVVNRSNAVPKSYEPANPADSAKPLGEKGKTPQIWTASPTLLSNNDTTRKSEPDTEQPAFHWNKTSLITLTPSQQTDDFPAVTSDVTLAGDPSGIWTEPLLQPIWPKSGDEIIYGPTDGVHGSDNGPGEDHNHHIENTVTDSVAIPEPVNGIVAISMLGALPRRRRTD